MEVCSCTRLTSARATCHSCKTAPHRKSGHSLQNFWFFGCYLLPLAVLELYLRAKESVGPSGRFAMAGGLVVLMVLMGVGIFGIATFMWRPLLEAMK